MATAAILKWSNPKCTSTHPKIVHVKFYYNRTKKNSWRRRKIPYDSIVNHQLVMPLKIYPKGAPVQTFMHN